LTPLKQLSLFEDNSVADAINSRKLTVTDHEDADIAVTLWVLPFMKGDVPVGASLSITDPKVGIERFSDDAATVSSNTGAIYLESLGLKNLFRETPQVEDGETTERHYEILLGMARERKDLQGSGCWLKATGCCQGKGNRVTAISCVPRGCGIRLISKNFASSGSQGILSKKPASPVISLFDFGSNLPMFLSPWKL
jgi:hypothetical protein